MYLARFCQWLSNQTLARLFGYTRDLERRLADIDRIYLKQIDFEREEYQRQIEYLKSELATERAERKVEREGLLDRALARNNIRPIYHKPTPEEAPPKPAPYRPPHEAAIEEAQAEHNQFKSMMQSAQEWAKKNLAE